MRVIASYCELATLNLHMLTYIYVGLRKIKVSDGVGFQVPGFRWFHEDLFSLKIKK